MAAAAEKPETEVLQPSAGDIVLAVEASPQIVLLDPAKFDAFYERVKEETSTLVVDLTTKKGRDEIRSMAAKVTRSKTMIDKAGLELTKQWREQTSQVNAARKDIEARLDALADATRKPLTDWEEADQARLAACMATMEGFRTAALVTLDDTADTVRARGFTVHDTAIDPDKFLDLTEKAEALKKGAVGTLLTALQRLEREEKERAELAELREKQAQRDREDAERVAREQAEREAREAAERAAAEEKAAQERAEREAKEAEERRAAAAQAEKERVEKAREEAAEQARREAEQAAQRRHDEEAAAAKAEIDAANARAAEAEAAAEAERQRAAQAEEDRKAEEDRLAVEQRKRDEDQAHRTEVKTKAKVALMTCGADEETAKKIVLAIVAGEVPAVSLRF